MSSPADDIPLLERLMRNVLRLAFEQERGPDWITSLSMSVRQGIERVASIARDKRPDEKVRDDWDAAGIDEMGALLRSEWPPGVDTVWPTRQEADVDLARLKAYRDKNLHSVGLPTAALTDEEMGAIIRRLRVRFEAWRRNVSDERGDWWPYVAAVSSNIPEFCFERSSSGPVQLEAVVNEGDLVTLDVMAVHPTGASNRLEFTLLDHPHGVVDVNKTGSFAVEVPRRITVEYLLFVRDIGDAHQGELVNFRVKVRPRRDV